MKKILLCSLSLLAGVSFSAYTMENQQDLNYDLNIAVRNNNIEKVKEFLDNGAKVNLQNFEDENTALMYAVDPEMVKLLLDKGANVDLKNRGRDTALIYAIERSHMRIIGMLKNAEMLKEATESNNNKKK